MLAVPQLGFWLSLCVAVGASAIVPDRVTAHTDFSAGKTPNSYSALTARIVIDQVRYSRIDVPDREFGTADNGRRDCEYYDYSAGHRFVGQPLTAKS